MRTRTDSELGIFEQSVLDFASRELLEKRQENDRCGFGPLFEGVLKKAGSIGFFSVTLPEELDGSAMSVSALCLLLDDLCRFDASLAGIIFADTLAKELVYQSGDFPALCKLAPEPGLDGFTLFACQSHHDPAECIGLKAVREGDGTYLLSGKADFVVLGGIAPVAVLPAPAGAGDYSLFLVDLTGAGVNRSEPIMSLGLHACPAVDIDLELARGLLVGDECRGRSYFEAVSGKMHAAAAAMYLGIVKGSFEEGLSYAGEREQGGRRIVNWTEVRRMLARMAVKVKAADMIVSEACRAADEDEPGWELGAMAAALLIGEMACDITSDGIQVLGGNGYMEDFGQEKRFRDAQHVRSLLGMAPMRELEFITKVVDGEQLY